VFSINVHSQGKGIIEPDYEVIKASVSDPSASSYYPKLMKRYLNYDETLTEDEFRLLYYGFIYQNNYDPYSPSMEHNALALYLEKETLDTKDCDAIINYVNISMIDYPFNFHLLRMSAYALHLKGTHVEADKRIKMLDGVIQAILSSGDGKSMRTAFHVIYTQHEYEIVNYLGYNAEYQTLNNIWDIISISKNDDKIPALYFNVGEMLDAYKRKTEKINSGRKNPKTDE
jgi:hypothetical protein